MWSEGDSEDRAKTGAIENTKNECRLPLIFSISPFSVKMCEDLVT